MWYYLTLEKEVHVFSTLEDALETKNKRDSQIAYAYDLETIIKSIKPVEIIDHTVITI